MQRNTASSQIKRTCKLLVLASTAAFVIAGLTGCGGSGTGSTSSPFIGSWTGSYSGTGESGTANVTILANGAYTGSGFDNTTQMNYTVSGAITNAGIVTGTLTEGSTSVALNGTWSITNGHLGGNVTVNTTTDTYNMTPAP